MGVRCPHLTRLLQIEFSCTYYRLDSRSRGNDECCLSCFNPYEGRRQESIFSRRSGTCLLGVFLTNA